MKICQVYIYIQPMIKKTRVSDGIELQHIHILQKVGSSKMENRSLEGVKSDNLISD